MAIMISKVKTTFLDPNELIRIAHQIIKNAKSEVLNQKQALENTLANRWNQNTRLFVENWFSDEVRVQLQSLINQINKIENPEIRIFFKLVFSRFFLSREQDYDDPGITY